MFRADGKRLKNLDPMSQLMAAFMTKRSDAQNAITLDVPLAPIKAYIQEKRKEGRPVSHMAVIMASYLRLIAEYPALNRFVVNKQVYARKYVTFGMVVLSKNAKEDSANHGTMGKLHLELTDTVFDVERKVQEYVEKNRVSDNEMEKIMKLILAVPGMGGFIVGILKILDRYGLLPKAVIEASPFHNTLVFTNLASIRTNHILHHCYDFGTVSMVMAAGNAREVPHTHKGQIVLEKCMPLGCVMDERIASGSYFGHAFHRMQMFLSDPHLLEEPPKIVNTDPEL